MQTYYDDLIENGVPDEIPADGFTFEDMFDEHIANNQKTWKQDRRLTVGASECFACIRKNWFVKRGHEFGIEPDPSYKESWGAMERGNIIENHYIVPAVEEGLARRGLELIMAGDGQDTILDGIHSATLDGLIIPKDGGFLPEDFLAFYDPEGEHDFTKQDSVVLEMKSFDPRLTLTHEKSVHRGQTQMQMGMIRDTTEYKPNYAILIYVNASWLDDIRIFVIPFSETEYQTGRARNERVFETTDPGKLHAEGKLDGMCDYCKYQGECAKVSVKRVPKKTDPLKAADIAAQDTQLVANLDRLTAVHGELKHTEKKTKAELEEINEQIRQALIDAGQSRAAGDDWKIAYTAQKGRKTISKDLMVAAGLDPDDFTTEGAGFEKLTVTHAK